MPGDLDPPIDSSGTWRVTEAMQNDFVTMSGDANPIHTDPIAARRLPFGRVTVHGLHLALDAVERVVDSTGRQPTKISATFRHAVGVDDEIGTAVARGDAGEVDGSANRFGVVRATVTTDAWVAADVTLELGDFTPHEMPHVPPAHEPAEELDGSELVGRVGAIAIAADAAFAERRFPHLTSAVGLTVMSELLSLTRLVGAHVPGLHSLFSSFDISLTEGSGRDGLAYEVTKFDERFGLATIHVDGPNVSGSLRAFLRAKPVEPAVGTTSPRPDEFAGQRWLVVGGSRGLGAIAVLLLDAGGGDIRFTFRAGADDATALATRTTGATPHQLDVLDPATGLAAVMDDGWRPTHFAFFASPPVFDGVKGTYSSSLESRLRAVHVTAFERLVDELAPLDGVLWPSSAAVTEDVPGLAEYAAVKREGEALCDQLRTSGQHVHAPRFPRLRTDQTASFVPVEYGDAPGEVLAALRATTTITPV